MAMLDISRLRNIGSVHISTVGKPRYTTSVVLYLAMQQETYKVIAE